MIFKPTPDRRERAERVCAPQGEVEKQGAATA
jgi:hypothetical protein